MRGVMQGFEAHADGRSKELARELTVALGAGKMHGTPLVVVGGVDLSSILYKSFDLRWWRHDLRKRASNRQPATAPAAHRQQAI